MKSRTRGASAPAATLLHLRIQVALLEPRAADLGDAAAVAHAERLHLEAVLFRELPDVGRRLFGDSAAGDERAVSRVAQRPRALREIGRVGRRRPGLAVLRHFAAAIQVVEQHELLGQRVLVRRDVAAEQRQARIAVALLEIAEHLIVGAVLFHDEQDVLDRRAARRPSWESRWPPPASDVLEQRVAIARVVVDLFRVGRTRRLASGVSMNEIRPFRLLP